MKNLVSLFLLIAIAVTTGCVCHGSPDPVLRKANSTILETGPRSLPIVNAYRRMPGCYIACYANNNGVYSVGNNIYVRGLVRVNGLYLDRNCQPQGYFFKDISALPYFKEICNKNLRSCKGQCWAGGDTGGFLGIPQ